MIVGYKIYWKLKHGIKLERDILDFINKKNGIT
jgi:hypothetical protein